MIPPFKIAPSILSADFGRLNEEIASIEDHVDFIHVDVMDGHFVPNLTLGAPVVACLKSKKPMECHLMIEHPEKYVEDFIKAGAWMITIHVEATSAKAGQAGDRTQEVLEQIRVLGGKSSLSLNPETPVEAVEPYLDLVDMILVMSVHPGFGGQSFIHDVLAKVKRLRELRPMLDIGMDGGVTAVTAALCVEAGANVLVAGSYIFEADDRVTAIRALRELGK